MRPLHLASRRASSAACSARPPRLERATPNEASGAEDKRFVRIPQRGHNTVSLHPLYWEELAAFLRRIASDGAAAVSAVPAPLAR